MEFYNIEFKHSVEKDIRKIPKSNVPVIIEKIKPLSSNPFPSGIVKLRNTENIYRLRAGDYRIVYQVLTDSKKVIIHYIRHRKDAYR